MSNVVHTTQQKLVSKCFLKHRYYIRYHYHFVRSLSENVRIIVSHTNILKYIQYCTLTNAKYIFIIFRVDKIIAKEEITLQRARFVKPAQAFQHSNENKQIYRGERT